ncbi:MAG: D-serine ammonia-lyase [Marinobacterium sp.]|nr:D-serine ammonia-lyase [Marinobacterium sp.]
MSNRLPESLSAIQINALRNSTPQLWLNPELGCPEASPEKPDVQEIHIAEARLQRFAPLLATLFPELNESKGIIESQLLPVRSLASTINPLGGHTFIKADHALPVAGSIKARGGIHEVLCFAEQLALENNILSSIDDDYSKLLESPAQQLFNRYEIAVGSTGNLGLSIGIIGAALGFRATVHMSVDAKAWKKARLRKRGVTVIEHNADYGAAVAAGRTQAETDPFSYFVDDENSPRLFMGYAVAALRLQQQLDNAGIRVDNDHPLFVYLPAGVGGAPGGITFGLKALFGNAVHCFFAEPVQAPCMLLGMAGKAGSPPVPVYNAGLHIDTDADGLAVGTAAQWVCDAVRDQLAGVYTETDDRLYGHLAALHEKENIQVEPSAAIGCSGPGMLNTTVGRQFLETHQLVTKLPHATHLIWTTGGSFVPDSEYKRYIQKSIEKSNPKVS